MRATFLVLMLLAGCQMAAPVGGGPQTGQALSSEITLIQPEATDEICWTKDLIPAVMGTGMDEELVVPEKLGPDGTVVQPAIFRQGETEIILEPEKPFWFRSPCPSALDRDFISSVQRALEVRGVFSGPITGILDAATRDAIHAYQAPQGLDSDVLSLKAAQQMGLANYDLDAFDG